MKIFYLKVMTVVALSDALTLDMSAAGAATFNSSITLANTLSISSASTSGFLQASSNILQFGTSSNDPIDFYANNTLHMSLKSDGEFIVNESGNAEGDFRVESDSNTHMLFVDAGNNRVGIGETSPDTPLHLTTSGTGFAVTIESTSGSATSGPDISIFRNSPSPADEDDLGRIYFHGENDAGSKIEYGMIRASVNDVTAGTEDSSMQFYTYVGGAQADRLALEATETVLNESSKDVDFRVESDNLSSALFVDGANGNVTMQGATTTIGSAAASTNIELNLNGVASKAQRIQFQESGTNRWLLGQGAASETSAFELYNAGGVTALSVDRTSNVATFQRGAVFNEGSADSDFRVESRRAILTCCLLMQVLIGLV